MRTRPLLALVAALAPLALGVTATPASANNELDRLRQLLDTVSTCVETPPAATSLQICTDDVRRTLDDVLPVEPAYPEYVVVLKQPHRPQLTATSSLAAQLEYVAGEVDTNPDLAATRARQAGASIRFVYRNALRGYAAAMSPGTYATVAADPAVDYIEENVATFGHVDQPNATWGIDRIDQRDLPLDSTYHYHATGAGVRLYVADSGVRYTHTEYAARVTFGIDTINAADGGVDCHGHGSHTTGTAGGLTYGVAKSVKITNVRVLDCTNSGTLASYVGGMDYIVRDHLAGTPAVANISIGFGGLSTAGDTATQAVHDDGVATVVSAGNSNTDACNVTPAHIPDVMTVGATTSTDARASFSNWGSCVDWFAPGENIVSASHTSDTGTATKSGTSMAAPHTAGVAAQILQADPTLTPTQVRDAIYAMTTKNKVTSASSADNHLLYTRVLVHLAAGGTIELARSSAGVYSWDTTAVFDTDFTCQLLTSGTVRVECTPKPSDTVVWHCNFFVLDAWAPAPGDTGTGNVKGSVACDGPDTVQTADVVGSGTQHTTSAGKTMGTAGLVSCRAAGIGTNALPTGSYKVLCNEPGVEKPLGPGGYE